MGTDVKEGERVKERERGIRFANMSPVIIYYDTVKQQTMSVPEKGCEQGLVQRKSCLLYTSRCV